MIVNNDGLHHSRLEAAGGVSVIIPAFNAESSLVRAISSCRSALNCEVIVVDDGSADRTLALAEELSDRVISQPNSGAAIARHVGLESAKSEFIIFLDADDALAGEGVRASIDMLRANDRLVVAAGRIVGEYPSKRSKMLPREFTLLSTQSLLHLGRGPFPPGAAVIRREGLLSANHLDIPRLNTRFAEDYEMFIRLSMVGEYGFHEEVSLHYSLFSGKATRSAAAALEDKETIRRHYAETLSLEVTRMTKAELKSAVLMRSARHASANNKRFAAALFTARAIGATPLHAYRRALTRLKRLTH